MKILLLIAGGALGTLCRYYGSLAVMSIFGTGLPYGTLGVNMTGSFLAGLLWGVFEAKGLTSLTYTFLFIGLLGGFTTFSSFALESVQLFRQGDLKLAVINILANNIFGILLCAGGFFLAKSLMRIPG